MDATSTRTTTEPDEKSAKKEKGLTAANYAQLGAFVAMHGPLIGWRIAADTAKYRSTAQRDLSFSDALLINAMKQLVNSNGQVTVEELQKLEKLSPIGKVPTKQQWVIKIQSDLGTADDVVKCVQTAMRKLNMDNVPEDELPQAVFAPVKGEWEARRKHTDPIKSLTPEARYALMQDDLKDKETVLLYFHGGAYYVGSPSLHRSLVLKICGGAGIKAFSVDYRLSPGATMPAALTDCLAAYDYLINPPPGALHKPVPPSKIILGGDSAGGGLTMALLLILKYSSGRWPMPGGAIVMSPWLDLTTSFMHAEGAIYGGDGDYLPDLVHAERALFKVHKKAKWPHKDSTAQPYCHDSVILHPFATPLRHTDWSGICPVIVQCGAVERLAKEIRCFTQQLHVSGVPVRFDEYDSMPHVFQLPLGSHKSVKTSLGLMSAFILDVAAGKAKDGPSTFHMRNSGGILRSMEPWELCSVDRDTIEKRMQAAKTFLIERGTKTLLS